MAIMWSWKQLLILTTLALILMIGDAKLIYIDTHEPAANWEETSQYHVISLNVPGIEREFVEIKVEEDRVLKVSGTIWSVVEQLESIVKWHLQERPGGWNGSSFCRTFTFPSAVDMNNIKANLDSGVLTIKVWKKLA